MTSAPTSLRDAGILGGGTVVAAAFGLLFQSLISYYFGAGAETDAYFMSLVIFTFFSKLAMLTQLKSVALPIYRQRRDADAAGARIFANRLLLTFTATVAALTLLLLVVAPVVIDLLAPGYTGRTRDLTITLFRIRLPALIALAATTVVLVALESARRFDVSVSVQKVVPAIVGVVLLVVVADRFGIVALAWIGLTGTILGGAVACLAERRLIGWEGIRPLRGDADVRTVARSWLRFGGSNLAMFVGEWVFRVAASLLPVGLFSGVLYGRMVHDLLHGAINDSATTVALPRFAGVAATSSAGPRSAPAADPLGRALLESLRSLAVISLPVALFAIVGAPRIVALLFGHGRFLEDGMVEPASIALALFSTGFFIQGLNQLAFSAAFAAGLSALVNRVQLIGHLFRAVILVPMVMGFSYVGLVAAQVLMNGLVAVLISAMAPAAWGLGEFWKRARFARGFSAKLVIMSGAQVAAFALVEPLLSEPLAGGVVGRGTNLLALGLVWLAPYLALGWVLGVAEVRQVVRHWVG
ncbi:MAG: hypothetical protein HY701_14425 [Gemmatimonadetes bacterium]|nr:hypothetical protein [Gemmatimonadota bacterium]